MRKTERVPSINLDGTFPDRDITDSTKLGRAAAWITFVETLDKETFKNYMDRRYTPRSIDSIASRKTYNASVYLCREWDTQRGDSRHFVSTGFIIGRAFTNDTALLPNCDVDMYTSIERMKKEISPYEFARAAWNGMAESHPNVFSNFHALFEMAGKRYDFTPPIHAESFKAGVALPYMLSVGSQLEIQAKNLNFTSMSDAKHNLRTTQFTDFFTAEEPLVSDNPVQRLRPQA